MIVVGVSYLSHVATCKWDIDAPGACKFGILHGQIVESIVMWLYALYKCVQFL